MTLNLKAVTRTARRGLLQTAATSFQLFDNQYIKDGKARHTAGDG
jgi:hypothetical protein